MNSRSFDSDQHEATRAKKPFTQDKLHYNEAFDQFTCPMSQVITNVGVITRKNSTGFKQAITQYRNTGCQGCPLHESGVRHKSKTAIRTLEVNWNLNRHRKKAHELLNSERSIYHRKKQPVDTEPVFGHIKSNHGFRRGSTIKWRLRPDY